MNKWSKCGEGEQDESIRKEESEAGKKKNKEAVGGTQLSFSELVKNLSPETKPDQKLFIIPRREKIEWSKRRKNEGAGYNPATPPYLLEKKPHKNNNWKQQK